MQIKMTQTDTQQIDRAAIATLLRQQAEWRAHLAREVYGTDEWCRENQRASAVLGLADAAGLWAEGSPDEECPQEESAQVRAILLTLRLVDGTSAARLQDLLGEALS